MEPLKAYISQARERGQTDEQIRQSLLAAGWQNQQINSELPTAQTAPTLENKNPLLVTGVQPGTPAKTAPSTTPNLQSTDNIAQQTPSKLRPTDPEVKTTKVSKLPIAFACLLLLIIVIGGSSYFLFWRSSNSYQSIIQQFLMAMEDKDKSKANALESPAFKAEVQKYAQTTSFYDACQEEGQLCTASFSSSYLAKATKTYQSYTASNGVKGKEVVYTVKQSLGGAKAGSSGCSSHSTSTLSIAVVPSGRSWLVDNINDSVNANANLCLVPGGSSSTGN